MTGPLVNISVFAVIAFLVFLYWHRQHLRERKATETLARTIDAGLEPVSLHPTLDPNRCIGTGACVDACPEGDILGIVAGVAELIHPTRCIGHGACAAACPVDAITLVFGTEHRGVDIPHVSDAFETNVGGIYVAGELGGMGLIRNAVTQGRQAIENISRRRAGDDTSVYDVAIIGAGPAGIAATLQAEKMGLRYVTFDQDDIGGTVLTYPRQKIVMTQPMELPLYGKCRFREIAKEDLLDLWHEVIDKTGIRIHTRQKVEKIGRRNGHFEITSPAGTYATQNALLAIGRRGSPRKLGVPGEDSAKVTYKLIEPEQYKGQRVLVVGGGDSAVEAALALAEQPGTSVSLSYRKDTFMRIKDKNQERLGVARDQGQIDVFLESNVAHIEPERVIVAVAGEAVDLDNDYVLVMIGGELPTNFLRMAGIRVERKHGER